MAPLVTPAGEIAAFLFVYGGGLAVLLLFFWIYLKIAKAGIRFVRDTWNEK